MQVPQTNYGSPFRFTRASHDVFKSRNLKKTEEFYTEVLGLVASYSDKDSLFLRGLEERAHHSLVFGRTTDAPGCERIGLRVFDDEALERCKHAFEQHQLPCKWVDRPFQGARCMPWMCAVHRWRFVPAWIFNLAWTWMCLSTKAPRRGASTIIRSRSRISRRRHGSTLRLAAGLRTTSRPAVIPSAFSCR